MQHCHTFVPCEILGDHIFKEYRIIACSSSFCMLFKYEASVKYRGQNFVDTGAGQQQWRMKIHSCLPIYHNSCNEHARLPVQRPAPWWQDWCCWAVGHCQDLCCFGCLSVSASLLFLATCCCYYVCATISPVSMRGTRQLCGGTAAACQDGCSAPAAMCATNVFLHFSKILSADMPPCCWHWYCERFGMVNLKYARYISGFYAVSTFFGDWNLFCIGNQ